MNPNIAFNKATFIKANDIKATPELFFAFTTIPFSVIFYILFMGLSGQYYYQKYII